LTSFPLFQENCINLEKKKTLYHGPTDHYRNFSSKQKITTPAKQMFEDLVLVSNFK